MKRSFYAGAVLVLIASLAALQTSAVGQTAGKAPAAAGPDQHRAQYREMLNTYCVGCHNNRAKIGGLAFDGLDLQAAADNAEIWEKALRKLRGQFDAAARQSAASAEGCGFVRRPGWRITSIRMPPSRSKTPKAGYVPIQRLNRTEYAASVKALVGVDVKANGCPAAGHPGRGLRQHCGCFDRVPHVPEPVHHRRPAGGEARDRQSQSSGFEYEVLHRGQSEPRPASASGHARRNQVQPQFPGRRRVPHQHRTSSGWAIYASTIENQSTLVIMIDGKIVFRNSIGGPRRIRRCTPRAPRDERRSWTRFPKIPGAGASRRARRRGGVHRSFPCGVRPQYRRPILRRPHGSLLLRAPRAEESVWTTVL